jgi:hypothetical protein
MIGQRNGEEECDVRVGIDRCQSILPMMLLLTVLIGLLSGCGDKFRAEPVSTPAAVSGTMSEVTGTSPERELQNQKERQMVLLFRGILTLDLNPETVILSSQAAGMLPLVKKGVEEGRLNESDLRVIIGMLTPGQKAVYYRFPAAPVKVEPSGQKRAETEGAAPEDHYKKPQGQARLNGGDEGPEDWAGVEKNVEQQLIELLESRLKE